MVPAEPAKLGTPSMNRRGRSANGHRRRTHPRDSTLNQTQGTGRQRRQLRSRQRSPGRAGGRSPGGPGLVLNGPTTSRGAVPRSRDRAGRGYWPHAAAHTGGGHAGVRLLAELVYTGSSSQEVLDAICRAAVDIVPGADHACISTLEKDQQLRTRAANDDIARLMDRLESEARKGRASTASSRTLSSATRTSPRHRRGPPSPSSH